MVTGISQREGIFLSFLPRREFVKVTSVVAMSVFNTVT